MVRFNLHYGQARTSQWARGRPVDMYHRATSPKKSLSFPQYGEYGACSLDARPTGVVETVDPYCVMSMMTLGYPLHVAEDDDDFAVERHDDTAEEVARAGLRRLGDARVTMLATLGGILVNDKSIGDVYEAVVVKIADPWRFFGVNPSYRYLVDIDAPPDGLVYPRPDLRGDDPFPEALRAMDSAGVELLEEIIYEPLTWLAVYRHMEAIAG